MSAAERSQRSGRPSGSIARPRAQRDRSAPHAPLAERHILGAIILDGREYLDIVRRVGMRVQDLYIPAHRLVYEAMEYLAASGTPIDSVTLCDRLVTGGQLTAVGGEEYLLGLTEVIPDPRHIEDYAQIVVDRATARRIQCAGLDIAARGSEDYGSATEYARYAQDRIRAAIEDAPVTTGTDHGRAP